MERESFTPPPSSQRDKTLVDAWLDAHPSLPNVQGLFISSPKHDLGNPVCLRKRVRGARSIGDLAGLTAEMCGPVDAASSRGNGGQSGGARKRICLRGVSSSEALQVPKNTVPGFPTIGQNFVTALTEGRHITTERPTISRSRTKLTVASFNSCRIHHKIHKMNQHCVFGVPESDAWQPPSSVSMLISRLSPARFEIACIPSTPELDYVLACQYPYEWIPDSARYTVPEADYKRAMDLMNFANEIHRACLRNWVRGSQAAAWYTYIDALLSLNPPRSATSNLPALSSPFVYSPTSTDFFSIIPATHMKTSPSLSPNGKVVKLDALVAFNPLHPEIAATSSRARRAGTVTNAFTDTDLAGTIIALGVDISCAAEGEIEAEYRAGVYAMKTLSIHQNYPVVSITVCGHVWSLHIMYPMPNPHATKDTLIAHGPVVIGATDTIYGTMKLCKAVVTLKEWAREELWPEWKRMLEAQEETAQEEGFAE